MVDQTHIHSASAGDKHNSQSVPAITPRSPLHSKSSQNFTNNNRTDDVIGSLANAYENERARQVVEWERIWRQSFSESTHRPFS